MSFLDSYQDLFARLLTLAGSGTLWPIPVFLALFAILVLITPRVRGKLGERRVAQWLARSIEGEALHDVILPDHRGGLTQIDHLVKTRTALLIIETKNYRGRIYGRANDAQWTQRLGRRSHPFQNPLRQNHAHVEAVKALLPGVPIVGRVVFTGTAAFPQGVPAGISTLRSLAEELSAELGPASPPAARRTDLDLAWAKLKAQADQSPEARKSHRQGLAERYGPGPVMWRPYLTMIVSALWLGWIALHESGPAQPKPHPVATTVRPATPATPRLEPRPLPSFTQRPQEPRQRTTATPECNAAIAAVLIDNSASNQRRRDRICGL